MSAPGNAAKLGTTDSTKQSVRGWDRTYNSLVSILLSQLIAPPCQSGISYRNPGVQMPFIFKYAKKSIFE